MAIEKVLGFYYFLLFPIFFLFFPIFVSAQAARNGHKRWAWATVLSIFILLGPLIGLLAYFKTKNPSEKATYIPPSPKSGNGIGTMFFGASDRQQDGSYVTTEWFVFVGIPLVPLRSDRVRYVSGKSGFSGSREFYDILGPAPLDRNQIFRIYRIYGIILAVPFIGSLYEPLYNYSITFVFFAIIALIGWGVFKAK
jgi:hypothetical protein